MIGGLLTGIAGSAWARTALRYGVTALVILLFPLSLRRPREQTERLAEQLETKEKTHDAQRRMLEATARRPRSSDDLVKRLREGRFCPHRPRGVSAGRRIQPGVPGADGQGTDPAAGRVGGLGDVERLRSDAVADIGLLDSKTSASMAGRLVLNDTTEILGSFAEMRGTHVSEETALWRNNMVELMAEDAVGLQGNFRTAEFKSPPISPCSGGRRSAEGHQRGYNA